jgi:hypothetical protein
MMPITDDEKRAARFIFSVALFYLIVSALSGCAYLEYEHLSDPRLSNDGYDLICAGLTDNYKGLTVSGGICHNAAPYGGEFVKINVRYTLKAE